MLLSIISCAQNFFLNDKSIKKYQDYDLKSFIKERFIERSGVGGFVIKLSIYTDKFLPRKRDRNAPSEKDIEDFRIKNSIYKAHYDSNTESLRMPRKDLQLFCKIKDGELVINKKAPKDYMNQKYLSAVDTLIKVGAIRNILELADFNHDSDSKTILNGYQEAMEGGYLGEFSCMSLKTNKALWKVGIYPVGFIAQGTIHIQSRVHILLLQIIPI